MAGKLMLVVLIAGACSACSIHGGTNEPVTRASAGRAPVAASPVRTGAALTVVLSADQAALVRSYFSGTGNGAARGNGRGRNGGLPPGIARNLQRGKALPPGIAKQTLPGDLVVHLPGTPAGLQYLVVAGKLLLVETATQVVRDVLLETVFG